jgi:hypothetical protein
MPRQNSSTIWSGAFRTVNPAESLQFTDPIGRCQKRAANGLLWRLRAVALLAGDHRNQICCAQQLTNVV